MIFDGTFIYPLTVEQKDALEQRGAFKDWYEGQRFTNDDPLRLKEESPIAACTCRVRRFNMESEQDRTDYANTIAYITSRGWQITWEERLKKDGDLIIFLSYMEIDYITKHTIEEIENDKQKQLSGESAQNGIVHPGRRTYPHEPIVYSSGFIAEYPNQIGERSPSESSYLERAIRRRRDARNGRAD